MSESTRKPIKALRENGPMGTDRCPHIKLEDREQGVSRVKWRVGGPGVIQSSGSSNYRSVAYLRDEHSKREVVEKWLLVNHETVKRNDKHALYRSLLSNAGREWKDALAGVWEDRGWPKIHDNHQPGENSGGTCPLCGEDYTRDFPYHRRNDCTA